MNFKGKIEEKRGITIIGLIVTIIILLILVGATLNLVVGEEGIIKRTIGAIEITENVREKEQIELAVAATEVAGEDVLTTENLNRELKEIFGNEAEASESSIGWKYRGERGYRIYSDGKVEESFSLPSEYQEVEYIESTGNQYIDTNEIANNINEINIKFCITKDDNNHQGIIGGGYTTSYCTFQIVFNRNENHISVCFGKNILSIPYDNNLHYARLSREKTEIDNIEKNMFSEVNDNRKVYLFARRKNELQYGIEEYSYCRIYYCEFYNENGICRKFIPCYRESDNEIGLFDLVEDKFYTNQGSGAFLKGEDV